MKTSPHIFLVLILILSVNTYSQVTVYSAPFNGGNFYGWASQNLGTPWGNQSATYNIWKVNTNESGQPANACGTTGAPSTLHLCSNIASGAAYVSNYYTNRRIYSPNISTVGHSNMTLNFFFIGNGCDTRDKAYLQYSINGGSTWISPLGAPTSSNPAMGSGGNLNNLKSQVCVSGQGRWTYLTWALPATCDNIANLRLAFVWQNNDGVACGTGSATDPSFAVYNLTITKPDPMPVELFYFNGEENEGVVNLEWATLSETNNDYFTIERSVNGFEFSEVNRISGAGNSNEPIHYSYTDNQAPPGVLYYRLKQTDFDGNFSYSRLLSVSTESPPEIHVFPVPADDYLFAEINDLQGEDILIELTDLIGKKHLSYPLLVSNEFETVPISISTVPPGLYLLRIITPTYISTHKIKISR